MKRMLLASFSVVVFSWMGKVAGSGAAPSTTPVTFNKEVLPILQKNCQACHRPGEVAPMPLLTFEQTRPWAKAIKTAVVTKKMPPWFADPRYGHFSNERKLTAEEIRTLVAWVDQGAMEGDAKERPAPVTFVDGWNIGQPDRVIEMPNEFHVPAEGTIDYQYIVIPGGFTKDTWVQAAEIRPGNRAVVHHVIAYVRPPGSQWLADVPPGVPVALKTSGRQRAEGDGARQGQGAGLLGSEHLIGYAPGLQPMILTDSAKLMKAGSDIVFQLHYTANGQPATDKSKLGLIFPKTPPQLRNVTLLAPNQAFVIPPNDDNYEVKSEVELQDTVKLVALTPHMHFRGKDFLYRVVYPSGETETLLSVPKYDFNWQLGYRLAEPLVLPKGARIQCTAHFDNSPNNPSNPDPTKEVRWGDQTWEEMMIGWFQVTVDPKVHSGPLVKMLRGSAKASIAPQPNTTTPSTPAPPTSTTTAPPLGPAR